jgi:uncharacterized protein
MENGSDHPPDLYPDASNPPDSPPPDLPPVYLKPEGIVEPSAAPADTPTVPEFTKGGTVVFCVLLIGLYLFQGSLFYGEPAIARLANPELTIPRVVDRDLEYWEATQDGLTAGERILWLVAANDAAETPHWSAETYREALAWWTFDHPWGDEIRPLLLAHFAVLLAETGQFREAQGPLAELMGLESHRGFAEVVSAAYSPTNPRLLEGFSLNAPDYLLPGWTQDRLQARLAAFHRNHPGAAPHRQAILQRGNEQRLRGIIVDGAILATVLAGLIVLLKRWFHATRPALLPGEGPGAPWSSWEGLGLCLRAECWAMAILVLSPALPRGFLFDLIHTWYLLFASIPLFILLAVRGSALGGAGICQTFGLIRLNVELKHLAGTALWAFALATLGNVWLFRLLWHAGISSPWTEAIDESLLWGSALERWGTVINAMVWAPLFEEVLFRGLLFATLRKKLSFLSSALISSAFWSATHFYSVPGFLGIIVTGVILCLAYERSRSLIPCMISHGLMNFFFSWYVLWIDG